MTSFATAAIGSAVLTSTGAPAEAQGGLGFDPLLIGMLVILGIMVFFMFRNSRKRKADAQKMQDTMVPGVDVMTNYGLFGTIVDIDDVANTAHIEIAPGTIVKVHRQTLAKVVDAVGDGEPRSVEEAMAIADREQAEREAADRAGADSTTVLDAAEDATESRPEGGLSALGKYAPGSDAAADEPKFGERLPQADGGAGEPDADKKPGA